MKNKTTKIKQQKLIKPRAIIVIKINICNIVPKEVDVFMTKTIAKLQENCKCDTSDIMMFYIPVTNQETDISVHLI